MPAKKSTIWQAEPHTIAKIEILRSYLYQWFAILGATFKGKDLWYIDGFSGPGEYTNHRQGSPLAALAAAEAARSVTSHRWVAGHIRCLFIEDDTARFAHLKKKLAEVPTSPHVYEAAYQGSFVEGVEWLRTQRPNPFSNGYPLFVFIDPFGPSGLSFTTVKNLLSRPTCEVLVNLDSDGVSRIYRAGDDANHRAVLNDVFGDDSWESELAGVPQHEAIRRVVALYKRKLRAIRNVRYAFSFEMRKTNDVFDYHLVFASQHPRGLERMKEVMKKIDQTGMYCFSDDHVGQDNLFKFDDPTGPADQMHRYFAGRKVPYGDITTYALNESPFANPKSMLATLEKEGRISVDTAGEIRTKFTFPDRLHDRITVQF